MIFPGFAFSINLLFAVINRFCSLRNQNPRYLGASPLKYMPVIRLYAALIDISIKLVPRLVFCLDDKLAVDLRLDLVSGKFDLSLFFSTLLFS